MREARDYDERETLTPRVNAKLTDMQAALARSQLARLDGFVARRRAIAARYRERFRRAACALPPDAGRRHVYHRFVVGLDDDPARVEAVERQGMSAKSIRYDADFGRPLDYYTGLVFEIAEAPEARPIVGGGRYDRLLTLLGATTPIPGVGFSVWLDRIEALLGAGQ